MNFAESQYCKYPRLVCISLGLWPYTYKRHRFRALCAYVVLLSSIICQLLPLKRCHFTSEVITVLGILIISFAYVMTFQGYYLNLEKLRHVFDYIEDDWKMFTNEGELETIKKYANQGKVLNMRMIGSFITVVIIFVMWPFASIALTNQEQSLQLPIHIDCLVEEGWNVFWILLYIDVQTILGTITMMSVESVTVIFMYHLCGVYRIVSDRLEKTVTSSISNARNGNKYSSSVRKQLIATLKLHQRLLELIDYLNKSFSKHYLLLFFIIVAEMSINLYVMALFLSSKKITEKFIVSIGLLCTTLFYMYFNNFMGQKVIDKGNELFIKTYSTRWYESPLPIQKTLLFVRLRCMKDSSYISTIFFVTSMECLYMMGNASISYFMMLYTTVQRL